MLDSESKLREAIQKMLNPVPPSVADHNHAGQTKAETSESMDDLFTDEDAVKDAKEDLNDLFEDDDREKE